MEIGCADFGTPYFYLDNLFLILNMLLIRLIFEAIFHKSCIVAAFSMRPVYRNTLFFIKKCK